VNFINSKTGWVVGSGILKTTDGGTNWFSQTYEHGYFLSSVNFTDSSNGWAVGQYGTIIRTTNGGGNWITQSSGTLSNLTSAYFPEDILGWAVGYGGTILSTYDGATLVSEQERVLYANNFILFQNYPNPFNPSTKISWQSPVGGWQTLKIYDVLGNEIATLVNEELPAGKYEVEFNPASSIRYPASGIYFYQLKAGSFIETKKMILIK